MAFNKPEILAPAGNFESLRAAVINGADAVYLGASSFSARAKAGNFDFDQLVEAVKYCHLFGVKVYLAVNTIIKVSEYESAKKTILQAKEAGVDAIIVQDLAFLSCIYSTMSDIPYHFSTQTGIHNVEGALVAEKLGASRIILSREVTLSDVEKICKAVSIEVEVFIHGALCVGFSGNCYFSSMATGQSGNRGKCLQLCRKKYYINGKSGYFLSTKDLDLSKKIERLSKLGVASLKIEGRMRRAEYVGETVKFYRNLLDGQAKNVSDINAKKLYNRGEGCEGYLDNATAPVIYPKTQGHIGISVGSVKQILGNKAILSINTPLNNGDGLKFLRNGLEVGSSSVTSKGKEVSFSGNVRVGDDVRITTDAELLKKINNRTRRLGISVQIYGRENEKLTATASFNDIEVSLQSDFILQNALNAPLTDSNFRKAFEKTGNTEFELVKFSSKIDGEVFCKISDLNEFRRKIYDKLTVEILSNYNNSYRLKVENCANIDTLPYYKPLSVKPDLIVQISDFSVLNGAKDNNFAVAFCPKRFSTEEANAFREYNADKFLTLPIIMRSEDVEVVRNFIKTAKAKKVIVNNLSHLKIAEGCEMLLGTGMNLLNPNFPADKIMSIEYDEKDYGDNYAYVYGKIPMMTFAHCPKKTLNDGKCVNCDGESLSVKDEDGKLFTVRFYKIKNCYAQLLNNVTLNALSKAKKHNVSKFFIDLVDCDEDEVRAVLNSVTSGIELNGQFTGGYFNKKLQ